ncbi:class I SAM-dependent methyltransferase [Acidihalobacter prosperus]|uniref:Methyltransferase type 11 domain-containing protein n=1 Tax=Acidihalobacter prosperus TaxID=160660 RepID=A0A1A6C607_9GAMM|nr:class I SAM-dependent methyltransferase [Acidihalobacter prosperus]OBS09993.1 hypothetical protein Thpro_021043 [Acidihalobacter prosperus]
MHGVNFYRAFEDRYRGSRELIKGRLRVYLPFVLPLKSIYDHCAVIDLGCGRGEWLELLGESGFSCQGVDLDEGMLAACRERGFSVDKKDAIEALEQLPDESQTIVSGFHMAEHIPFGALQKLVEEALRVLKPAGLLILETPNPENIVVGSSSFYSDPTHLQPLPPRLLSFLPDYTGFLRTKTLGLQEPEELRTAKNISLLQVLNGVSPDYAIVAQKAAQEEILKGFDAAYEQRYGLTLEDLAMRYEAGHLQRIDEAVAHAQKAEATALQALSELHGICGSRSWRMTAPLRWMAHQLRMVRQEGATVRAKKFVKKMAYPVARRGVVLLQSHSRLRHFGVRVVKKIGLYAPLKKLYGRMKERVQQNNEINQCDLNDLPPRARSVYEELDRAINSRKERH